jgi:hypothetical protein
LQQRDVAAQLRTTVIAPIVAIEADLANVPSMTVAAARASLARIQLEAIVQGADPLAPDGSLRLALERLVATAPCAILIESCDEALSEDVARAIWFCCAEGIANTAKHAPGASLKVDVRRVGQSVQTVISDDGPGSADAEGRGLRGVRDRIEALGGRFLLVSQAGSGTRMTITVPDPDSGQPQVDHVVDADVLTLVSSYVRSQPIIGGPT